MNTKPSLSNKTIFHSHQPVQQTPVHFSLSLSLSSSLTDAEEQRDLSVHLHPRNDSGTEVFGSVDPRNAAELKEKGKSFFCVAGGFFSAAGNLTHSYGAGAHVGVGGMDLRGVLL
ncbi:hypothetical protein CEXT_489411 [Caerostris extrusa]|uniref:Uncharacterized protein n=1 Tax=Caerostris extrusa TaxID=172846 RepID=A0AAV4T777_CAEEX|nr:hypothetical protein CEXT_489411 [Caerostris extrusa]